VAGNILLFFYKKKRNQNKKNNKILPATSACCGAVVRNECRDHFSVRKQWGQSSNHNPFIDAYRLSRVMKKNSSHDSCSLTFAIGDGITLIMFHMQKTIW
jgi:hypothetical protein